MVQKMRVRFNSEGADDLNRSGKEEEQTYIVKKISRVAIIGRQIKYLVRWEGYTTKDDTWEPEENLDGVGTKQMLHKFKNVNSERMHKLEEQLRHSGQRIRPSWSYEPITEAKISDDTPKELHATLISSDTEKFLKELASPQRILRSTVRQMRDSPDFDCSKYPNWKVKIEVNETSTATPTIPKARKSKNCLPRRARTCFVPYKRRYDENVMPNSLCRVEPNPSNEQALSNIPKAVIIIKREITEESIPKENTNPIVPTGNDGGAEIDVDHRERGASPLVEPVEQPVVPSLEQQFADAYERRDHKGLWRMKQIMSEEQFRECSEQQSDEDGTNTVHRLCMGRNASVDDLEVLKILAVVGGRRLLSKTDFSGQIPLHYASKYRQHHQVVILISNASPINTKDQNGKTPLDLACADAEADAVPIIRKLIIAGAFTTNPFSHIANNYTRGLIDDNKERMMQLVLGDPNLKLIKDMVRISTPFWSALTDGPEFQFRYNVTATNAPKKAYLMVFLCRPDVSGEGYLVQSHPRLKMLEPPRLNGVASTDLGREFPMIYPCYYRDGWNEIQIRLFPDMVNEPRYIIACFVSTGTIR